MEESDILEGEFLDEISEIVEKYKKASFNFSDLAKELYDHLERSDGCI